MAFTDNFDKIKSPISNREILNLITPVKNKIDTFHDLEVARLLDKELNHPQLSNAKSSQGKDDLKQQIQNVFDKQEVEYMMFAYELQKEEEAIEQRFQNVFDQQEDESMMFAYELQKKEEAIEQQILNDRKIAMQLSS
jgi:50S ribosomal subunit-associated GTPase HflX